MRRLNWIGTCVIIALAAQGCSDPDAEQPVDLAGRWSLAAATIEGVDHQFERTGDQPAPTLVLDRAGAGQAITGCEVASVRAEATGADVTISIPEVSSMMSCPPGSVDRLDGRYDDALVKVERGVRSDSELVLTGPAIRLVFEPLGNTD